MKTNSELRQDAKMAMSGNWGAGIAVSLVGGLLMSLIAVLQGAFGEGSVVGNLLYSVAYIFAGIPISYGIYYAYLRFCREGSLQVANIFSMFNDRYYIKSVTLGLLVSIYTVLWTLLLIVPGIIKSFSYFLAPFILFDNPELSAEEAICRSMKMMQGHKMRLFLITLGFAGLAILSALLLFIPMLWLVPFYQTVFAKFYEDVKAETAF